MNVNPLPTNFGCLLDAGSEPEAVAVVDLSDPDHPATWTYGALDDLCNSIAGGLLATGLAPGARVGLMSANSVTALAVLFGAVRAGFVAVPINPRSGPETVEYMCTDSAMELIFADAGSAPPPGFQVIPLGGAEFDAFLRPEAFGRADVAPNHPDDPALILYTSGSTGRPKGVELSHSSQILIADNYATPAMGECLKAGPLIVAAPLFHMNATVFSTVTFLLRGAMVLMARFDAGRYIAALAEYRVSVVSGVPTMAALIAQETEALARADLSGVKLVAIGSAPLSDTVLTQVHELFPGAGVINSYGTTETGAGYFGSHPLGRPRPPMSVGYPQANAEFRLVGDGGPDTGVLEIRSPTRMTAYVNQPALTAERIRDGWINTGDIMRRDADGWYYFVGRDDDMFVCAGENIYPGAVERVLERHPDVLEVCVLPLADPLRGHVPVAFVVARPGSSPTETAIKDYVLAHAAPFMHPRHVWFIDRMPLAGTNKIDRRALAERAQWTHAATDNR